MLSEATGISDDDVIERLLDMDLSPETIAAVTLVPLVQVAWADGSLDRRERDVVLASARESSGLAAGGFAYRLIEGWLDERPNEGLFEAWQGYVNALRRVDGPGGAQEAPLLRRGGHQRLDRAATPHRQPEPAARGQIAAQHPGPGFRVQTEVDCLAHSRHHKYITSPTLA